MFQCFALELGDVTCSSQINIFYLFFAGFKLLRESNSISVEAVFDFYFYFCEHFKNDYYSYLS